MNIYHYWDSPEPPEEVLANIGAVKKAAPGASMTLLDKDAAERLIAQHHGPRSLAAFRDCGPPAMQADYLRLCIMDGLGGFYLDTDETALRPLDTLIDPVDAGLVVTWINLVSNNPLFFRYPKHPFISACLTLATENIELRRFDDVLMTAGPGVITAIYCAGDENREAAATHTLSHSPWNMSDWRALLHHAREVKRRTGVLEGLDQGLTAMDVEAYAAWIHNVPMDYKKSSRHWPNWTGSIYGGVEHANEDAEEVQRPDRPVV